MLNGVLFIFADTLLDPTLVLVAFISHLTSSMFLIGLIVPIHDATWYLPQFGVAKFIQDQPLKMPLYKRMSLIRIMCWAILAASFNFIQEPNVLLITFFITYTIASLASGVSGLPFLEAIVKTIPPNRRGELFAWRLGLGGLLGILASGLVRWLIDPQGPLPFPNNFGLLAVGFFIIATISLLTYNNIREPVDKILAPRRKMLEQVNSALGIFRTNQNYRLYLISQCLLMLAGSSIPFFAVFVQQNLGGNKEWIGIYLAVFMGSNLLSNLVFGRISRKFNNQIVMVIGTIAGFLMSLIMLIMALFSRDLGITPFTASLLLIPVFFLSGIRGTGLGVSGLSLLLNIAPPSERTLIIGFTQTIMGIVLLLNGLSGIIVGTWGFTLLVAITTFCHIFALFFGFHLADMASK